LEITMTMLRTLATAAFALSLVVAAGCSSEKKTTAKPAAPAAPAGCTDDASCASLGKCGKCDTATGSCVKEPGCCEKNSDCAAGFCRGGRCQ
jgi:hypothetical protein